MKIEILEKLSYNSTGKSIIANEDIIFPEVTFSDGSKSFSLYTHEGEIYILDNLGMDIDFEDYPREDQEKIHNAIISLNLI